DALDAVVAEVRAGGGEALGVRADVAKAEDMQQIAERATAKFRAVHLLFNNAGVAGGGGYVWETSLEDWRWLLAVNLMGVVNGIRSFIPLMLRQDCECHAVNTASAAGLVSAPLMSVYNVSKHGVVTLSETLFHDLRLADAKLGVSVLCPAFVPTNIHSSERNRPPELTRRAPPTASQIAARERSEKAVGSGRLSAAEVARMTFDAVRENASKKRCTKCCVLRPAAAMPEWMVNRLPARSGAWKAMRSSTSAPPSIPTVRRASSSSVWNRARRLTTLSDMRPTYW